LSERNSVKQDNVLVHGIIFMIWLNHYC